MAVTRCSARPAAHSALSRSTSTSRGGSSTTTQRGSAWPGRPVTRTPPSRAPPGSPRPLRSRASRAWAPVATIRCSRRARDSRARAAPARRDRTGRPRTSRLGYHRRSRSRPRCSTPGCMRRLAQFTKDSAPSPAAQCSAGRRSPVWAVVSACARVRPPFRESARTRVGGAARAPVPPSPRGPRARPAHRHARVTRTNI